MPARRIGTMLMTPAERQARHRAKQRRAPQLRRAGFATNYRTISPGRIGGDACRLSHPSPVSPFLLGS
jgi:hypothetical protein